MPDPTFADIFARAVQSQSAGRLAEAENLYRSIIAQQPAHAGAIHQLGVIACQIGRNDVAVDLIRRAIELKPDYVVAHNNLGIALQAQGKMDDAIIAWRRAIGLNPNLPEVHNNLAIALQKQRHFDEAIASCQLAVRLKPNYAEAYNNLGNAFFSTGQIGEAIQAYRQAALARPDAPELHGNLVFALQYHPDFDARMIHDELCRWNDRHGEPARKFIHPSTNDRDPERRLRIGYVSADFREHVVGRNLLPLFAHHDHAKLEIFCYSNVTTPDVLTEQFRRYADVWRNIAGASDPAACDLIRQDRIDILVDLGLHTAGNRLGIFARKPAPVQVTFAGYPGSTGLKTIDYRLTDPQLDPPGMNDPFYSETSIRLPSSFWCYQPLMEVAFNALPAMTAGYVTFGCLNNVSKINARVVELWAGVLNATANSRLLVMAPQGSARQRLLEDLRRRGVGTERVEMVAKQSPLEYLRTFQRIDVGLDTIPYNGHTTSLDSFWMGVPVVTLVGRTVSGRAGLSQLTNLGLTELAAQTPEEYVRIAAALAADLPKLAEIRRGLRARMESSALMDAAGFARNIESAYRDMWRKFCEKDAAN